MKKIVLLVLSFLCFSYAYGQTKNFIDQPYLETSVKLDTLVTPDKIYLSINLDEADSKNKKSTENQELLLEATLKKLNINTEKDLTLSILGSEYKSYFLKGQKILKNKRYSLLVYDAVTAGKVLLELETVGIANVNIEKVEYSKTEEMLLDLRTKAIVKAKQIATKMLEPLGQKIGKAIYIKDSNTIDNAAVRTLGASRSQIQIRGLSSINENPIYTEFEKIKFDIKLDVRFIIE